MGILNTLKVALPLTVCLVCLTLMLSMAISKERTENRNKELQKNLITVSDANENNAEKVAYLSNQLENSEKLLSDFYKEKAKATADYEVTKKELAAVLLKYSEVKGEKDENSTTPLPEKCINTAVPDDVRRLYSHGVRDSGESGKGQHP